ncbi:hypothetical protein [Rhizobium oryzicola]|uniref:Uncharacterized protein n=1 Tax=Rhizobium oryzicola TaxID=1232668 RepID=A0ABT8SRG2_9HYPH|nr:hypothetical protein [Rhizobium oryzicola]MDO1580684.1 hypothetical protein [Rhizobium oryzicola]
MPTKTPTYTHAQLRAWDKKKLETLRDNARRLGNRDVEQMCSAELASRNPIKTKPGLTNLRSRSGDVVVGYHFVCSKDRGVIADESGRFWTGSWVVAEHHVESSLARGAYLALHESKADVSYRQGNIVGYRRSPRDMIDKENYGIEFLVEPTLVAISWVGDGAGEKGYKWESSSSRDQLDEQSQR